MRDYKAPPETIPRIPGNNPYFDWLRAARGGPAACSRFQVSGPFTEIVLLGNLALRAGKKIEWDGKNMRAKNAPETAEFIKPKYRQGWEI
jgi:hypothetical protein